MTEMQATGSHQRQTSLSVQRCQKPPDYVCRFEWPGFRSSEPFSFAQAPQASPLRFRDFLSPVLLSRLRCHDSANHRHSKRRSFNELSQIMRMHSAFPRSVASA
jgi:hypothetical protein